MTQSLNQIIVADQLQDVITSRQAQNRGRWYGAFDIAVWLNAQAAFPEGLSLELHYQDDKGEHVLLVDRCRFSGNHTLLLSNRVSLALYGRVSEAHLKIVSKANFKVSVLESKLSPTVISADQYLQKAA